jgi:hypothetical protein
VDATTMQVRVFGFCCSQHLSLLDCCIWAIPAIHSSTQHCLLSAMHRTRGMDNYLGSVAMGVDVSHTLCKHTCFLSFLYTCLLSCTLNCCAGGLQHPRCACKASAAAGATVRLALCEPRQGGARAVCIVST